MIVSTLKCVGCGCCAEVVGDLLIEVAEGECLAKDFRKDNKGRAILCEVK